MKPSSSAPFRDKPASASSRWQGLALWAAIVMTAVTLYWWGGGFPPAALRGGMPAPGAGQEPVAILALLPGLLSGASWVIWLGVVLVQLHGLVRRRRPPVEQGEEQEIIASSPPDAGASPSVGTLAEGSRRTRVAGRQEPSPGATSAPPPPARSPTRLASTREGDGGDPPESIKQAMAFSAEARFSLLQAGEQAGLPRSSSPYQCAVLSDPGGTGASGEVIVKGWEARQGLASGSPSTVGVLAIAEGIPNAEPGQADALLALVSMKDRIIAACANGTYYGTEALVTLLLGEVEGAVLLLQKLHQGSHPPSLVCGLFAEERLCVANAGDNRVYLFSQNALRPLTEEALQRAPSGDRRKKGRAGHMPEDRVVDHLGVERTQTGCEIHLFTVPLQAGDLVMMCSAGLWSVLHLPYIEQLLRSSNADPEAVCSGLLEAVRQSGSSDPLSVIATQVQAV